MPSRYCEEGRFYVQVKTQGRIFLHVPARGFKEICQVLLARQSISVLLPLFWSGTSTVYFYQTFESESTSSLSSSSRYSNHNIPGGHANFKQVSRGNSSLQGYNNPSNAGVGFCDTWYESLAYLWNCMNQNISSELRNYSKVIPKAYLCYMGIVFDVLISFKLQWFVFSICDPDSNLCNSLFIHKLLISCTDLIKAIGYLSVFAFLLY